MRSLTLNTALPDDAFSVVTTRHSNLDATRHATGLSNHPIIKMDQVHGNTVHEITGAFSQTLPKTDAVFTQIPKVVLAVKTADCLPILIYHPSPIIAAIHAGRRSTDAKILEQTLRRIAPRLHSSSPLHIWFGPHICQNCYEINPVTHQCYDLTNENIRQIHNVLTPSQVQLHQSDICTAESTDQVYSYRKEGNKAGRFYSLISIQD